jgi:flagellar hook-basal body complex protein FliE
MIDGASGVAANPATGAGKVGSPSGFADLLKTKMEGLDSTLNAGNSAATDIATGDVQDITKSLLKVEEANVSLQLATQIRNKAVEAYQEVLRMQI